MKKCEIKLIFILVLVGFLLESLNSIAKSKNETLREINIQCIKHYQKTEPLLIRMRAETCLCFVKNFSAGLNDQQLNSILLHMQDHDLPQDTEHDVLLDFYFDVAGSCLKNKNFFFKNNKD